MLISLKWQIQLWHAMILTLVLVAMGSGFYFYVKRQRIQELDQWMDQQMAPLVGTPIDQPYPAHSPRRQHRSPESLPDRLGPPDGPPSRRTPSTQATLPGWESVTIQLPAIAGADIELPTPFHPHSVRELFEEHYAPLGFYAIVTSAHSGEIEFQTSNAPEIQFPKGLKRGYFVRLRENRYRELVHSNPMKILLVGADLSQFQASLLQLKLMIGGSAFGILIFGLGIGHLLVSRSLSPIKSIVTATKRISDGELSQRIPKAKKNNTTEFVILTEGLNQTFEKLESLFERQLRFTADASHELRTPLTALLAQLEHGLDPERTAPEIDKVLKISARSSERIWRITEQLLELTHYDTKQVSLDYVELPMDEFLIPLVDELELYVRKNGSEITTDIKSGNIECDPFRVHQVITNLVNNALQHNDASIQLVIRAYQDKGCAVIEVADNGKGIQPDNVDKLFDRFYQENTSRTKLADRHNLGLGLSICQAIVEAHGGSISVRSQPNIETVFSIRIPMLSPA